MPCPESNCWSVQRFLQEHGQVQLSAIGLGEFSCSVTLLAHTAQSVPSLQAYWTTQLISFSLCTLPAQMTYLKAHLRTLNGQSLLPSKSFAGPPGMLSL